MSKDLDQTHQALLRAEGKLAVALQAIEKAAENRAVLSGAVLMGVEDLVRESSVIVTNAINSIDVFQTVGSTHDGKKKQAVVGNR